MKFFAFALLLISSFSSHASEFDATEALIRTLPLGVYSGVTPQGSETCSVEVKNTPQGILVTATKGNEQVSRSVGYGTVYRWNRAQRLFLSSDNFYRGDVSEEVVLRTIAIDRTTQFVVVSHTRTMGRDRVFNNEVACEVSL